MSPPPPISRDADVLQVFQYPTSECKPAGLRGMTSYSDVLRRLIVLLVITLPALIWMCFANPYEGITQIIIICITVVVFLILVVVSFFARSLAKREATQFTKTVSRRRMSRNIPRSSERTYANVCENSFNLAACSLHVSDLPDLEYDPNNFPSPDCGDMLMVKLPDEDLPSYSDVVALPKSPLVKVHYDHIRDTETPPPSYDQVAGTFAL